LNFKADTPIAVAAIVTYFFCALFPTNADADESIGRTDIEPMVFSGGVGHRF
jgi:hypothetical protein